MTGVGELMVYSTHNYELLGEIVRRLSGRTLEHLARERVFDPLGLRDSYYEVPESEAPRVVQRAPGIPFGPGSAPPFTNLGSRRSQGTPWADGGLFTTPLDMARFGQAFPDGGRSGNARILAPASVAAMTRNQIPGVRARLLNHEAEHGSWGYGWGITSPSKWRYFDGSLQPLGTCGHSGAGGSALWVDREHELVGAYFEVCTRLTDDYEFLWNFGLFQNAITAAVDGA